MKFIHLSDLHLGKRVEDQQFILTRIINIIDEQIPDAVIIAGDVYDKPVPPAEAVELFDSFLVRLVSRGLKVFVISGNHDSAERVAFGAKLMDKSGVYLSPVYNGEVQPISLEDGFGSVNVYLLPYIKPVHVRRAFPDEEISSMNEAVACAVKHMDIDPAQRNILVAHQFVSGAESCDSEVSVGGTESVDASVFEGFDYVALGHLHGPQSVDAPHIRYSGSPLKYSFSEEKHVKSVSVLELGEKGDVRIELIPLEPKRDMLSLKGSYEELLARDFYESCGCRDAYLQISLTDEEEIPGALSCLRLIYPNIMKLEYDNIRSREFRVIEGLEQGSSQSPMEIFEKLYFDQNNQPMSDIQREYVLALIAQLEEDMSL